VIRTKTVKIQIPRIQLINRYDFRYSINEDVLVEVYATEKLTSLAYNVMGRGVLTLADTFDVSNDHNTTFKFKGTFDMIPKADILVYYVRPDGELISDKIEIKFSNQLRNFVRSFSFPK
jgi:CD109 antigen